MRLTNHMACCWCKLQVRRPVSQTTWSLGHTSTTRSLGQPWLIVWLADTHTNTKLVMEYEIWNMPNSMLGYSVRGVKRQIVFWAMKENFEGFKTKSFLRIEVLRKGVSELTALLYKCYKTLVRREGDLLVKLASTETVCELWVVYRLVSVVNKLLTNCMYNV